MCVCWCCTKVVLILTWYHLFSLGCPRPNSALTVHKSGLKHHSSIHPHMIQMVPLLSWPYWRERWKISYYQNISKVTVVGRSMGLSQYLPGEFYIWRHCCNIYCGEKSLWRNLWIWIVIYVNISWFTVLNWIATGLLSSFSDIMIANCNIFLRLIENITIKFLFLFALITHWKYS